MKISLCGFLLVSFATFSAGAQTTLDQCAIDLCGPPTNYLPYRGRGILETSVSPTLKALIVKKLNPALNAMIETELANLRLRVASIDTLILRSKAESIGSDLHAFLTLGFWLPRISGSKENILSPSGNSYVADVSKMTRAFPELSAIEATNLAAAVNAFLATTDFSASQAIGGKTFDTLRRQLTDNGTYPSNETNFYRERLQDQQMILSRLGEFALSDEDTTAFQKVISRPVTESEKRAIKSLLARVYSLKALLNSDVVRYAGEVPFTLERAARFVNWERQRDTLKGFLETPSLLAKERNETLKHCRVQVNRAFSAAPTAEMLSRTRMMTETIKTASIETAKKYFSGKALEVASETIRTAQFVEPTNAEQILSLVEGSFETSLKRLTATNRNTSEAARGGRQWNSLVTTHLFRLAGEENSVRKDSFLNEVRKACDEIQPKFFEDAALGISNLIQMGWQTALFPEVGIGIVSHELAHLVSAKVAALEKSELDSYSDVRACSTSLHADLNRLLEIPGSNEGFQEEDWADAFAATTLKSVKKSGQPIQNFTCALVDLNEKTKTFEKQSLLDLTGLDSHSTGLLRALQLNRSLGGKIPQSCVSAVGADLVRVVSRTCAK